MKKIKILTVLFLLAIISFSCKQKVNDEERAVTKENISHAEKLIGISFSEAEKDSMLDGINNQRKSFEKMRKLGKITADFKKNNLDEVMNSYEKTLRSLLNNPPGFASWINMLQHALGYVSDKLKSDEKELFLDSIEEYRDERIPLKVLFKILHSWALRFNTEYLLRQSFLKPYPLDLLEITDSGKGRDK